MNERRLTADKRDGIRDNGALNDPHPSKAACTRLLYEPLCDSERTNLKWLEESRQD